MSDYILSEKYYLGLDNGGTTTKAALFDEYGNELCVSSMSTAMLTPKPNFIERDMEDMWIANCNVIADVIRKSGISPKSIRAVGVCGHGKGLYLWGKNHKPARNGIISTDNRAYSYPEQWKKDGTLDCVFPYICQQILSCQPVSLLAWIRDYEPEVYQNIEWIFECKDYIRFRLTGEAHAELTDYSGTGLLNLHTKQYDDRILKAFMLTGISDALPPLCLSTDICGYITPAAAAQTGLMAGTPVSGGMFDIDACAIASGLTDEHGICVIAGTWSINEYLRRRPVLDGSVRMNSLFCLPEYYLIEESSPTSAGNNEWFIKQLLPELKQLRKDSKRQLYDEMNAQVAAISPYEFIPVFLPFIMASNVHPNAKGSFIGITANHTRWHLLRSVYEGIVFCHRQHIERLLASRESAPKYIRLAGGAAQSEVWVQMFADILQLPIETICANETGALGCAIASAVAVGDYKTLKEATEHMCKIQKSVLPRSELCGIYTRKYKLYQETIGALDCVWNDYQKLIQD